MATTNDTLEAPTYWRCTLYDPHGRILAEQSRRGTRASVRAALAADASTVDARGGFEIQPDVDANNLQGAGLIP